MPDELRNAYETGYRDGQRNDPPTPPITPTTDYDRGYDDAQNKTVPAMQLNLLRRVDTRLTDLMTFITAGAQARQETLEIIANQLAQRLEELRTAGYDAGHLEGSLSYAQSVPETTNTKHITGRVKAMTSGTDTRRPTLTIETAYAWPIVGEVVDIAWDRSASPRRVWDGTDTEAMIGAGQEASLGEDQYAQAPQPSDPALESRLGELERELGTAVGRIGRVEMKQDAAHRTAEAAME